MTTEVTTEQKLRDYLKRATADLRLARRRVRELEETEHEPVAVVGMACRFPGGIGSPEELWEFVTAGGDAISAFPADRGWDMDALFSPDPERSGTSYLRHGGFLYDAGDFDAEFFGISPREAMAMDPQQRLLLETSWEALERAAIAPDRLRGERVGVYVGALASDYGPPSHRAPGAYEGYLTTGNTSSVASGRLAFTLGLEGPALTVDTACSSSLVALHLAVQALRRGECTMALTGGVTVMSQPGTFVDLGRQQGLAPDGRCKAFSSGADGFGPAEGVGMLVVERLSDARRLGHRVLAVVRGSVVNQDGASNGLTAPSGAAQERLVRAALAGAGLAPGDVDVVEAHGTGTKLGDPIEARALLATYGQGREAERPLLLGSVKSNIGHTQAAAGVAGVIKMVMALRHGVLPASLHVDEPSSLVDWSSGAVEVVREAVAWPDAGRVRRAGVSSFGISGTNAHVILEQAEVAEAAEAAERAEAEAAELPVPVPVVALGGVVPWVVSGRGAAALRAVADRLATGSAGTDVAGVAGALVGGRSALADRAVVWGRDTAELTAGLHAVARGETAAGTVSGVARSGGVVFVFPGQGAQWVGMGRELLETSPVFAAAVAECEAALSPWVDWSLTGVLAGDGAELERVDVVQPVLWAVMVSLAAVWRSVGVVPVAVVGHSQGEIAAACVAGALSLEDAARVVVLRSRAITRLAGSGGMVSVFASADEVESLLSDGVGIAAVNGPGSVVVSGPVDGLDVFVERCETAGVQAKRVAVDYASHSAMVEALEAEIVGALSGVVSEAPAVPMLSTYTGEWVKPGELDGSYWYGNLRHRVRLADAVAELSAAGHGLFVEVSPHPVLTAAVQDTLDESPGGGVALGTLRREQGGAERLLASVAESFVHGADVDWTVLLPVEAAVKAVDVELPTYPFQRERYWLDSGADRSTRTTEPGEVTGGAFWEAVEQADLGALTETLGVDGDQPLREVLPALSAWRGRRRDEAVVDSWRYRVSWQPVAADRVRPDGTWLLVLPPDSGPDTLAHRAAEALATVVPVIRLAPERTVALDRAELAALILESGAGSGAGAGPVAGVLSLLALDDETPAEGPDARLPHVSGGLAATLVLLQALGDAGLRAPLWCATRGAVSLNAADAPVSVTQAEVWGLGRVAALEHPDRWGGLVDLPDTLDERAVRRLHAALAGVRGGVPGAEGIEDQLAIRASGLFVRRLERAPLGDRPPVRSWRPRGTVLVTGATGAVGRHLALWLAAEGAEHLVLTSRRPADTPELDVLRRDIAATGTTVTLAACDVADRAALAELIERTTTEGHRITAVVHAAALIQLGALDDVGLDELSATLAAKAAGADHLDELFDDDSLDAFVLFSSIAGVWGSGDHGTYAAGNAHIDALAQRRRARGRTALSVAWGVWDGCVPEGFEGEPERHGLPTIAPRLAFTALRQALEHDETHIAVAEVDWERFTTAFTSARPRPLLAGVPDVRALLSPPEAAVPGAAPHAGPAPEGAPEALSALRARLADRTEAERHAALLELVLRHTAEVLGRQQAQSDGVRTDRPFRELGVDSLTSVDLRNRLAAATGLRLPAALVFNHPTPLALARHLTELVLGDVGDRRNPATTAGAGAVVLPGSADRDDEPIAIVGMACRYPGGVRSPEDLWDLVAAGGDAVSGLPTDRGWDLAGMYDPDPSREGTCYTREGGFLHDVADFDPVFFGISPREALTMDPQQRLLLETSWEAFERADIDPTRMRGSSTGVFVGINYQDYGTGAQDLPDGGEGHLLTGTVPSVASGRVAYTLGLEGPAITLDTACSSSLVALHMAAQSLRRGECDMALAGGVAVMYTPRSLIGFSRQGGLAVDGRCKAFADAADGMGMAEGVGMLLVERLSDAQRLGHRVLAVVRASAINQDGASNGLSAPSGPAQERVIRAALAAAGLTSSDVDAVEAHGTGTKLGDPIEAEALLATYGQGRAGGRPLWLGSVKSNIGHTQAASGVAGVMKMVSAMRHGLLPASLHVDEPSSFVDWSSGAVEVVRETVAWPDAGRVRRAAVSSFGISGTNAHVILEQAEAFEPVEAEESPVPVPVPVVALGGVVPWVVSGRGAGALAAQAERLVEYAGRVGEAELPGVAYALATRRAVFADRAVVLGRGLDELTSGVRALASHAEASEVVAGSVVGSGVVFVFPGQGAQWVGMGRELLEISPVFAAAVAECEVALSPWVDWSLTDVLTGDGAELERVDVVQPVLWAVMVSLAAVWRSVGVTPVAVVGHSQGEIAAACVAGALSLEDAARVVVLRSRAITRLAGTGGMVSVFASAERVAGLLVEGVGIAAVNGPGSVVVSGEAAALDVFLAGCAEAGVEARRVAVDYASHSAMVEALEAEITESLKGIVSQAPAVPMLSTYTGEWVKPGELDSSYWYGNLRHRVRLADAVAELSAAGHGLFVEVSPHPVLTAAVQDTLDEIPGGGGNGVALGTLRREQGGAERLLTSVAEAFVHGADVDWTTVLPASGAGRGGDLPTYAFQRQRYWLSPGPAAAGSAGSAGGAAMDEAFWSVVESGDLDAVADTLGVDGDRPLSEVLPALSAWRGRQDEAAAIGSWRYRVDWLPARLDGAGTLSGTWLVVAPPGTAAGRLAVECAAALADRGADVVRSSAEVTAAPPAAYVRMLREAGPLAGVVSLLALDSEPAGADGVPCGLNGSLALVKALIAEHVEAPLWLVTSGAVEAVADVAERPSDPGQAQVWALGRVYGLEYPDRWGGLIDLPAALDEAAALRLGGVLAGGLGAEDQVALRADGPLVRRLLRAPEPRAGGVGWRPHGTVLITGGTGGLGGRLAVRLGREGARHLVLTSRRGPDAPGADELRDELTALGVEVTIAACDAADREALAELVGRVEAKGGEPITAVFHAAGIADTVALDRTEPAHLAAAHRAKGIGTLNLEELLGDRLEAFVLFSSNAAVWGSNGLAAYGSANAFLDAFAENRRRLGLPVTSIAWGLWEGEGMAQGRPSDEMVRRGLRPMAPEWAVTAMLRSVAAGETTLSVAAVDWELFHAAFASARRRPLIEDIDDVQRLLAEERAGAGAQADAGADVGAAGAASDWAGRLGAMPPGERELALVRLVRGQAATVLGLDSPDDVPAVRAFRELGFDSMMAVDIRGRLSRSTGLKLPATLIFDHPTPQTLARHLVSQLAPAESAAGDRLRRLLEAIPVDRLEAGAAGVEAALRALLDGTAPEPTGISDTLGALGGVGAVEDDAIDAMDAASLVRLAFDPAE